MAMSSAFNQHYLAPRSLAIDAPHQGRAPNMSNSRLVRRIRAFTRKELKSGAPTPKIMTPLAGWIKQFGGDIPSVLCDSW